MSPDALALAAFGQIIPQALLDLPPYGPINVHGSLLPAYRGAAPIQYALLNGETTTGVTTMWMDATLDTGDILLERSLPVDPEDTTGTLTPRLSGLGAELLMETLDLIAAGNCPRMPQDHSQATFAPPLAPEDAEIRWTETAERCRNRIRAMSPKPGAFARFRDRRLKLWRAARVDGSGPSGEVIAVGKEGVVVAAAQDALLLLEVQAENSRRMPASDWARGVRVAVGDRFA
jgi:methionyl-tRNA formyltransferase